MNLLRQILAHFLLASAFAASANTCFAQQKDRQGLAKSDPVLDALRTELERSKSQLKLDQVAAPYYIEYRVTDVDDYSAEAAFGALRVNVHSRVRLLRVVVRIGDYKQDSYFGAGEGMPTLLPVEDDVLAMRHEIWLATDRAYKAAAEALTAKQAQLKQYTIDQPVDDFAHASPVQSIKPLAKLALDLSPWTAMLEKATGVYKRDPLIEAFDSSLRFEAVNRYLVNSEGTVVRSGDNFYEMAISCSTQAADGMPLQRNSQFVETELPKMPAADAFVARASELAASLNDLRAAPVVEEEYRGPVLFSADAASDAFADLVGENVLGHKPALGQNGRTTGVFATSYKSRVLPEFLSVVDDPTISSYAGHALVGHYDIDDEGVPSQRVPVIQNGQLVAYLLGREPIRDFPESNGHSRARPSASSPGPSLGNLIISAAQPTPASDLKKKFVDLCKQRELTYCYRVETFGPKLSPRLLYKVWVKDGHEELARGAVFGELDTRALRSDLVAAGDDVHVESMLLNIPHSVAAPSILFDELELKRASINKEKLPEYPAPELSH